MSKMIELRAFKKQDCDRLISWIPDARFLMQFAGPQYTFPLDRKQIYNTIKNTEGDFPSLYMFKAVLLPEDKVIGHVELMNIDRDERTTHMGSVLIGDPDYRGKGLGSEMIKRAVDFAFNILGVKEVTLTVYDFNETDISCYRRIGFEDYRFHARGRRFEGEYWDMKIMRLKRDDWAKKRQGP